MNQEEIENMNTLFTSMEIETAIKDLPTNISLGPAAFTVEFYQTFLAELTPIILKIFSKNCRGKNTPKLILQGHHHVDTETRQRYHKKENYKAIFLMHIERKILNKMLATRIQQLIKSIIYQQWQILLKSLQTVTIATKLKDDCSFGTSLAVQWRRLCASNAGGPGTNPGQGTRSHMSQLRPSTNK